MVRAAVAVAAVVLGISSLSATLGNVIVKTAPAQAHALAPGDGRIAAALAESLFRNEPSATPNGETSSLARRSLLQEPTATDALTVLAFQAQLRGENDAASSLFAYSFKLSRREYMAQVWAIEQAVGRGDVAAALSYYDIALRTSKLAPEQLFPVLAVALADGKIRAALTKILATSPPWTGFFIDYAARSGADPESAGIFFDLASAAGVEVVEKNRADLVTALVDAGKHDLAWRYYSRLRTETSRNRARDSQFTLDAPTRTPFDWQTGEEAGISVSLVPEKRGGSVEFASSPTAGGTVLQQLQLLPPGSYRLSGKAAGIDQPGNSLPYWSLMCLDGREVGRVGLPSSGEQDATFTGRLVVSPGCTVQTLKLVVKPTDKFDGVMGVIKQITLVPE